jgi:hypothetical protein
VVEEMLQQSARQKPRSGASGGIWQDLADRRTEPLRGWAESTIADDAGIR